MNGAHFHLVLNHLPIIFPIVGIMVLVLGLIFKSNPIVRTAYFIFIIGAITSVLAMASGEEAEEVVEKLSIASDNFIHRHEETAEIFASLTYILAVFSLLGLWANFNNKIFSNKVSVVSLVFALVVLFFAKQTGTTGGEIRHTEIRKTTNLVPKSTDIEKAKDVDDE